MKKAFAVITLVAMLMMSICAPAYAIGISGYANHYTGGSSGGSFNLVASSIWFPYNQITIRTEGFNSDTVIVVELWDANGNMVLPGQYILTGNQERANLPMSTGLSAQTYSVVYYVMSYPVGDDGTIHVWIY